MAVSAKIEGKGKTAKLIVTIDCNDLDNLPDSNSGKTKIVATTNGNTKLAGVSVKGKEVTLGLNAYVK